MRRLRTSPDLGLTVAEARQRLDWFSPNEIAERGGPRRRQILAGQLTGVLTFVLIAAATISVFLGDTVDAIVILAIVVLNAALGYFQEYRAEQSMAALKRLLAPTVGHPSTLVVHPPSSATFWLRLPAPPLGSQDPVTLREECGPLGGCTT